MKNHFIFVFDILMFLALIIDYGLLIDIKKDLDSVPLNQNSHEELHSKNDSSHISLKNANAEKQHIIKITTTSPDSHLINNSSAPKAALSTLTPISGASTKHIIVAEGGLELSTAKISLSNKANETVNQTTNVTKLTTIPSYIGEGNASDSNQTSGAADKFVHKRIHGRPGVPDFDGPSVSSTSTSTTTTTTTIIPSTSESTMTSSPCPKKRKKKPLFTMITGDKETKESDSFIESSTTGRDYVVPIVLMILSLPILVYIIKIIYKRGTEFTERQQYHRMYLIDGMYNSRQAAQRGIE